METSISTVESSHIWFYFRLKLKIEAGKHHVTQGPTSFFLSSCGGRLKSRSQEPEESKRTKMTLQANPQQNTNLLSLPTDYHLLFQISQRRNQVTKPSCTVTSSSTAYPRNN